MKGVDDFLQYYQIGDKVKKKYLGTLAQHFGRFTLSSQSEEGIIELVNRIQSKLKVIDTKGNNMYTMLFDTARLSQNRY